MWTGQNAEVPRYEIKTDDGVQELESFDDVVRAVRNGQVGRSAQIREAGQETWDPIASVEALSGCFPDDIWSAWEEESDDSLLDAFQQTPDPSPVAAEQSAAPVDEVEDLPADFVVPVEPLTRAPQDETDAYDSPRLVPPTRSEPPSITPSATTHPNAPRRPPAKVIEFPAPPELRISGANALDLKRKPVPREVRPPRSTVRWGPIVLIGGAASAAMMLWVWFVNVNADAGFTSAPTQGVAAPTLGPPLSEEQVAVASPYDALEDDIREQLMEGILDITGESAFEDALLIELRRVRVDVRSVRVDIHTWAGRNKDVPDEVSFNLKVMGAAAELDRDLGALGMVLGKYVQHYGLQVRDLNIILSSEDGLRKIQMNPETARRYFTHRVSLERFLATAFASE